MSDRDKKVPKRIAQTILNSLKGGVVPRIGLPYITVGRKNEIEALLHDVDIIAEGGAITSWIEDSSWPMRIFLRNEGCREQEDRDWRHTGS